MSEQYRRIREKCRSPMDKCDWCGHLFRNGEEMALAQPLKGRNWVLCQHCADEALSSDPDTQAVHENLQAAAMPESTSSCG